MIIFDTKIEKSENNVDNNQDKSEIKKEEDKNQIISTKDNKMDIDGDKKDDKCCNHDGHEHHHEEKKVVDPNEGITTFQLGDEFHKFDDDDEVNNNISYKII